MASEHFWVQSLNVRPLSHMQPRLSLMTFVNEQSLCLPPKRYFPHTHTSSHSRTQGGNEKKRERKIELMLKIDIKSRETWYVRLPWKEIKLGCYYYFDQFQLFCVYSNILRVKMRTGCFEHAFIWMRNSLSRNFKKRKLVEMRCNCARVRIIQRKLDQG